MISCWIIRFEYELHVNCWCCVYYVILWADAGWCSAACRLSTCSTALRWSCRQVQAFCDKPVDRPEAEKLKLSTGCVVNYVWSCRQVWCRCYSGCRQVMTLWAEAVDRFRCGWTKLSTGSCGIVGNALRFLYMDFGWVLCDICLCRMGLWGIMGLNRMVSGVTIGFL